MANCYCNLRPAAPLFVSLRLPFSANLFSPVRQYIIRHGFTGTCNSRWAPYRRGPRHCEVATRDRRSPGAAGVRPHHVFLHIFAFLQSCPRQFLLRHDGSMASLPRLVVANPDRQFHALCRRNYAFFLGALGALSTPAFSLHSHRSHPAGIWAEHSAADRQSFWDHATWRPAVWAGSAFLFGSVVRLLGQPPVHGRRAVCSP